MQVYVIGALLFCSDIDECDLGTDDCTAEETCYNNEGGYTCCGSGYDVDGSDCVGMYDYIFHSRHYLLNYLFIDCFFFYWYISEVDPSDGYVPDVVDPLLCIDTYSCMLFLYINVLLNFQMFIYLYIFIFN